MKRERKEIVDRLDDLLNGIHDTNDDLRLKTIQAQRSPAQALRRIHSLEPGTSHSHTQLPSVHIDTSDNTSTSSIETSPSSTHLLRADSLPNSSFNAIINNHKRTSSPNLIRRNSSLTKRQGGLPTIPDSSVYSVDGESSSDESQGFSPLQVVPLSPEPIAKLLINPHLSKHAWPKISGGNNQYYTLPNRRSSTPTSPLHKVQFNKADFDNTSINSVDSSSMVLQISSATGQLEKVPKPPLRKQLFISSKTGGGSIEHLQMSTSLPNSSRLSVSSYFIGPGFEDTRGMIMKLSEEPAPSRSNSISSITSSHSSYRNSGSYRNSLILSGKETSV